MLLVSKWRRAEPVTICVTFTHGAPGHKRSVQCSPVRPNSGHHATEPYYATRGILMLHPMISNDLKSTFVGQKKIAPQRVKFMESLSSAHSLAYSKHNL